MRISMKQLRGYRLRASDGDIGHVDEFFFDDEQWIVRYIVENTGGLNARLVLISPIAVTGANHADRSLSVSLTREQVRSGPSPDLHRPISRQFESDYSRYYGYLPYWGGPGFWGAGSKPAELGRSREVASSGSVAVHERTESHLRSSRDIRGHHIQAADGEIGHLEDIVVDDETWAIRSLLLDTSNWIGGTTVVVPREAVKEVSWPERKIYVSLTREQVRESPTYQP